MSGYHSRVTVMFGSDLLEINPFRLLTIYFPFQLDGKRDYD